MQCAQNCAHSAFQRRLKPHLRSGERNVRTWPSNYDPRFVLASMRRSLTHPVGQKGVTQAVKDKWADSAKPERFAVLLLERGPLEVSTCGGRRPHPTLYRIAGCFPMRLEHLGHTGGHRQNSASCRRFPMSDQQCPVSPIFPSDRLPLQAITLVGTQPGIDENDGHGSSGSGAAAK